MATVLEKYKIQLPAKTMTYEELLDWADEDDYAEWADGGVSSRELKARHIKICWCF